MGYDAVVILGSRPVKPDSWELPQHVYASLDRAAQLQAGGKTRFIVTSGKWTINFDVLGIHQPFTESSAMKDYLVKHGVQEDIILCEDESQDTISNFYYLKTLVCLPRGLTKLHFIAAGARLERIKFLAERILGSGYELSYEEVPYKDVDVSPNEVRTLAKQAAFLEPMTDGDHAWLHGKFYDDPFYQAVKRRVVERAHLEPLRAKATKLPK